MKYLNKLFMVLCLMGYGLTIQAQNTIPAAGGNATGSGGSVSYSVGQVTCNTYSSMNGTIAQGVQQPYEISVVTDVENTEGIVLEYKVYPNPTSGLLRLIIKPFDQNSFRYKLVDINSNSFRKK